MTPKRTVMRAHPNAELVRDGCRDLGDDGLHFYDFAIFTQPGSAGRYIAEGSTPRTAWDAACRAISRRKGYRGWRVTQKKAKP